MSLRREPDASCADSNLRTADVHKFAIPRIDSIRQELNHLPTRDRRLLLALFRRHRPLAVALMPKNGGTR